MPEKMFLSASQKNIKKYFNYGKLEIYYNVNCKFNVQKKHH